MKPVTAPVCSPCLQRLCDRCVGRCLCTHNDPMVMAAQSLAETMSYFRAGMNDAGYAAVLHHFKGLADALPVLVEVPAPTGR